ncbi:MAG TPA: hypothetical protein VHU41_17840 [Thermoanaerobaculia bacterium]|nr:hypothetical protein [Thermoanaerobaculia bacterium]
MGVASWVVSGIAAFLGARIVPFSRQTHWKTELVTAILAALAAGVAATILDFGGWRDLDWRSAAFAFCFAVAVTGVVRAITMARGDR